PPNHPHKPTSITRARQTDATAESITGNTDTNQPSTGGTKKNHQLRSTPASSQNNGTPRDPKHEQQTRVTNPKRHSRGLAEQHATPQTHAGQKEYTEHTGLQHGDTRPEPPQHAVPNATPNTADKSTKTGQHPKTTTKAPQAHKRSSGTQPTHKDAHPRAATAQASEPPTPG
ncbi:hypothetical protein BV20DRAFT_940591, partial [Pilatotrama ljubarskyi]